MPENENTEVQRISVFHCAKFSCIGLSDLATIIRMLKVNSLVIEKYCNS
jgi:hypothetical protein